MIGMVPASTPLAAGLTTAQMLGQYLLASEVGSRLANIPEFSAFNCSTPNIGPNALPVFEYQGTPECYRQPHPYTGSKVLPTCNVTEVLP